MQTLRSKDNLLKTEDQSDDYNCGSGAQVTTDDSEKKRRELAASLSTQRISDTLAIALPKSALTSVEKLQGGCRNVNLLLRFDGTQVPLVMRIYVRDPAMCHKEVSILTSAAHHFPVPEIIYVDKKGEEGIGPFVLYPYIEGLTFQELKSTGNLEDMAKAAFAMGRSLARLQAVSPPLPLASSPYASAEQSLNSPVLIQRIGERERDRLQDFISGWQPQVRDLYDDKVLVHGDFNNRNTIIRRQGDQWLVTGILDWELAFGTRAMPGRHPSTESEK
jgi:aminoglycoside phosphotransferase (APT) family kinase protein